MLYITCDHGGFALKNKLIWFLSQENVEHEDMGPSEFVPNDDYPDYVIPVMRKMDPNTDKAILICKNGVGVSMLANKFEGIRCSLSHSPKHAESSRLDDNTNVLALPADYIDDETAKDIVAAWLATEFSYENRHTRRLEKVEKAFE